MKLTIDTVEGTLTQEIDGQRSVLGLYTKAAFDLISEQWIKVGWNQRYSYSFSWMGRPTIQLPQDLIRIQEVIYRVKPDVIIETGIAHGGTLIFYASLCKAMGRGRVIGVDIEIRSHNRRAIEGHELSSWITLIEGSSTAPEVVTRVKSLVNTGETALVILDSDHSKAHVLAELKAYAPLVTPGSFIVATDGIMQRLNDVPRGRPEWVRDNPAEAAVEFAGQHPDFILERPDWPFRESELTEDVTHWSGAWLRKQ